MNHKIKKPQQTNNVGKDRSTDMSQATVLLSEMTR